MFSATKPPPASSGWSTLSSTVSGNDHCCRFMSSRSRIPSPALESKRSSALRYKRPLLRVPESPVRFEGHCPRSQVGSRLTGLADYRETARWGGARGVQGLSAAVRKRGSPRLVVSGDGVEPFGSDVFEWSEAQCRRSMVSRCRVRRVRSLTAFGTGRLQLRHLLSGLIVDPQPKKKPLRGLESTGSESYKKLNRNPQGWNPLKSLKHQKAQPLLALPCASSAIGLARNLQMPS